MFRLLLLMIQNCNKLLGLTMFEPMAIESQGFQSAPPPRNLKQNFHEEKSPQKSTR